MEFQSVLAVAKTNNNNKKMTYLGVQIFKLFDSYSQHYIEFHALPMLQFSTNKTELLGPGLQTIIP